MQITYQHDWHPSTVAATQLQKQLASQVSQRPMTDDVHLIAGIDVSVSRSGEGTAAVVILDYPGLQLVESKNLRGQIDFPYIPGLLSFREIPLVLKTCEQITNVPDLIFVDGQGIAHPRRFGIASHLGLLLDIPTIGCAKSRLYGTHQTPGIQAGNFAELLDSNNDVIGVALRTRDGIRPLYVSIGHKISLEQSIRWVLACCRGFRLPEPARMAHRAAGGNLKPEAIAAVSK